MKDPRQHGHFHSRKAENETNRQVELPGGEGYQQPDGEDRQNVLGGEDRGQVLVGGKGRWQQEREEDDQGYEYKQGSEPLEQLPRPDRQCHVALDFARLRSGQVAHGAVTSCRPGGVPAQDRFGDVVGGELVPTQFFHVSAPVKDEHSVTYARQVIPLRGQQQDRQAILSSMTYQLIEVMDRPHVYSLGWFIENKDERIEAKPLAEQQLLLV